MVRGRRARFFRLFRFSILHISPGPLPPPPPPCQLPRDALYMYLESKQHNFSLFACLLVASLLLWKFLVRGLDCGISHRAAPLAAQVKRTRRFSWSVARKADCRQSRLAP